MLGHLHMLMTSYCCAQHRQLCANYCQSVTLSLMNMTSNSLRRNPSCWWSHRVTAIDRQLVKPIGGNHIEHVECFSHLGHIITSNLSDKEDIHYRRNCFIGQSNNVLCFFSKQRCSVRKKNYFRLTATAGATENARPDIARPSKLWGLTSRDWTTRHHIARVGIARLVSVFE